MRLVGKDPGVLDEEKRVLNDALRTSPRYDGLAYHTVAQLVERIDSEYALRWATALSANPPPEPERTARSIAAYLLDRGLSGELLHSWWTKWLYQGATELTLVEILQLAQQELVARPLVEFEVLVAFKNSPKSASGFPKGLAEDRTSFRVG